MAETIKGISVVIGSDTQGLQAALGDVNKQARDIQGELTKVERLLKLDPSNTELVAQKQKLLGEAVSTTKDKLSKLREAQEQVNQQFQRGEINEGQYRAFQREVAATEQELKKLEDRLKSSGPEAGSFAQQLAVAGEKLGKFGDKATNLGKKLAPLSTAAGGVVVSMVGMAVKAGQSADDINTLAKTTGLATDTIQKFRYGSDLIDVSFETLSGSLVKLTRNMATAQIGTGEASKVFAALGYDLDELGKGAYGLDELREVYAKLVKEATEGEDDMRFAAQDALEALGISFLDLQQTEPDKLLNKFVDGLEKASRKSNVQADAFRALGVEFQDAAGNLRNNEDVFGDVIDALAEVENETERDALAMQLFGKSAMDLNPLILGGADALKELGDEAEAAGLILSQDALDAANEFNDGIDKIKAQSSAAFMKLGGTIGEALMPKMEKLVEWVGRVAEWFGKLDPKMANTILTIAGLVAGIAPALLIIGKLSSGVSQGIKVFTNIAGTVQKAGGIIGWITSPVGIAVIAVGALIAAGIAIWKNWDAIKEKLAAIWGSIKETAGKVWDGIVTAIKAPINLIIDAINLLIKGLNKLNFKIPSWIPVIGGKEWGFKIPEIPKLAAGGVVTRPTLAMLGERGPEAVVPLSQLRAVLAGMPGYGGSQVMEHTGVIRVEGVNDKKQLVGVVEIIKGELRREGRL